MITSKSQLFPLAVGTFGLGAERVEIGLNQPAEGIISQPEDLASLRFAFDSGLNFIETSYKYAGGQTLYFLANFFKQIPRKKIFITVKIERYVEKPEDIDVQLDKYLSILGIGYADSILLHSPAVSKIPFADAYARLADHVRKGKARFLSASNVSIDQIKLLTEKCGYRLFSIEGLYNLECKVNEDTGLIKYCQDHGIVFACYQPLRRNRTAKRNFLILVELAKKYGRTQNQVLLNWIVKEKRLMPLVKTSNIEHIRENLGALDFEMDTSDLTKLNEFRNREFDSIAVDWEDKGGIPIYKLANQFS